MRNSLGKPFGPPPKRGPNSQVPRVKLNSGRLVEPKLKKRKKYGNRSEYSKTIKTDKGYTNVPSMYGGQEYNEDFLTEMYKNNKIDPETGRRVKTYKTPEEATVAAKRRSSRLKTGGFNPEGSGYDYKNAPEPSYKELGYFPKYGSLDPKTGMVLKGRKHPTYKKTEEAEEKLGNKIIKKGKRYYSVKKKKEGGLTKGGPNPQVPPVKLFKGGPYKVKILSKNESGKMFKMLENMFKNDENFRKKTIEFYEGRSADTPTYNSGIMGAYTPTKEASGITTKETMGLKKGKMVGCPHRERGARSDIKGISKIQVKGKKFTGVF